VRPDRHIPEPQHHTITTHLHATQHCSSDRSYTKASLRQCPRGSNQRRDAKGMCLTTVDENKQLEAKNEAEKTGNSFHVRQHALPYLGLFLVHMQHTLRLTGGINTCASSIFRLQSPCLDKKLLFYPISK
jgi:hypothetical protein